MSVQNLIMLLVLCCFGSMACNKQVPPRLDYTRLEKEGVYASHGSPGRSHIGRTAEDEKHHGYIQPTPAKKKNKKKQKR